MRLRRLLPEPGMLTAAEAVDGLVFADLAPADRPYLVLNMVATADGAATVAQRTAPISNAADRQLFHELRAQVDAVMVGAGTARIERYGRLVRDRQRRERRAARGLGQLQGDIGCVVAVLLVLGTLDVGLDGNVDRQLTGRHRGANRGDDGARHVRGRHPTKVIAARRC